MPNDQDEDFEDEESENEEEDNEDDQDEQVVKLSRKQIRALERKAKKFDKAEAETKVLRKERAFDKAGVKVDTPSGEFFAAKYDGDLDPAVIRETAEKLGIPLEEREQEGPPLDKDEDKSTKERQDLASGGQSDDGQETKPDPHEAARKAGQDWVESGKGEEDAMAQGLGVLAAAVKDGDTRAGTLPSQ